MLRKNLSVCAWLFVALCAFLAAHRLWQHLEAEPGTPFSVRLVLGPLAFAAVELLFLLRAFAPRDPGQRPFAAFLGVAILLLGVLVPLLASQVREAPAWSAPQAIFLAYVSLSHLAFALRGDRNAR